jgi:hypothetical protein
MSAEVLQASVAAAPITDIKVPEVNDEYAYSVQASYKIGGKPVNAEYTVDDSSGNYQIQRGYLEMTLTSNDLPITLNGVPVEADTIYLFPGSYEIASTQKYIELGSDASFVVQHPGDYEASPQLEPTLSSEGQKVFKDKVNAAVAACVKSNKLKGGCGLDLAAKTGNGYKLKDGTVDRELRADTKAALKKLKAELDYQNPTLAKASGFYGSVETKVDATKGGQTYKNSEILFGDGTSFGTPTIDFSEKDPTVEWD